MSGATLNGHRVTDACSNHHSWGRWYAEAALDSEVTLEKGSRVELKIADLALQGAVLSGGPAKGRSDYWIVAGAGKWGETISHGSYASDAGVRLTKVLGDAARLAGETFESSSSDRVGPAWTRIEGPASRELERLAPGAWYVGEDGITRLGTRPSTVLPAKVTRITPLDRARRKVVLAAEAIAGILPGVEVDGMVGVDVQHEISASGGLRTTVWGSRAPGGGSRAVESLRAVLDQLDPDRAFRGVTEYRVVSRDGELLNLRPVLKSLGMPDLPRVRVMPGLPGCVVSAKEGSRVSVAFLNADPALPRVVGFESGTGCNGLELTTDGIGAGGHAVTLEQVLGLFVQYTAARSLVGDLGATFSPIYTGGPPAALLSILAPMIAGAVLPAPPGPLPGGQLDALGLPALIETALLAQLPDPASAGLPVPVFPGLAKKGLKF